MMSDLKRSLYGKNHFVAFLDGFRLKLLYGYVLSHCHDDESDRIFKEILAVEQRSYSEYSDSKKVRMLDVVKSSLPFIFPDGRMKIDMFAYLGLEVAYIRSKMNIVFLLSQYKLHEFNEFMATKAYLHEYERDIKTRDVVSDAILNHTYAAGETTSRSHILINKLRAESDIVV